MAPTESRQRDFSHGLQNLWKKLRGLIRLHFSFAKVAAIITPEK
jgi:hypothetical protein